MLGPAREWWIFGAAAIAGVVFVVADVLHRGGQVTKRRRSEADLAEQLASDLHEAWRKPRFRPATADYEPRLKPTADEAWIARKGTREIDIANTPFADLPADWQADNRDAARDAVEQVAAASQRGEALDAGFVERAAGQVHDRWRRRRAGSVQPELDRPYGDLPESEKEKDRTIVRSAIAIWLKDG